jgi:hypothetical protein
MLAKQWLDEITRETRQGIILRYARVVDGRPVFCAPASGKPVYDTSELAETAGRELAEIGGANRMRVYTCSRTGERHYHLTSKRVRDADGPR